MIKKTIAPAVAILLIVILTSCIPFYRKARRDADSLYGRKPLNTIVLAVQTKNGQRTDFRAKDKVTIDGGYVLVPREGPPPFQRWLKEDEVRNSRTDANGRVVVVETKDGQLYRVLSSDGAGAEAMYCTGLRAAMPLSDLSLVWIRKFNWGLSFGVTTAVVCAGVGVYFLINPPSCPFVYSFDGGE